MDYRYFKQTIEPTKMPISDILKEESILSRVLRSATALDKRSMDGSGVDSGAGDYYLNLILDDLIEAYAPHKSKHSYQEFFDVFSPKINEEGLNESVNVATMYNLEIQIKHRITYFSLSASHESLSAVSLRLMVVELGQE